MTPPIGDTMAVSSNVQPDTSLTVLVMASSRPNTVAAAVIAIHDTGGGIPENVRARIFDPFFTTKEVGKGTGQGLAIACAAVKGRHKGHLTFETKMGEGTTFFIRLPIAGVGPQ